MLVLITSPSTDHQIAKLCTYLLPFFYFILFYFWRKIGFYYCTIISNCIYTCGYPQSERWQADNEWWSFSHPYNSELQELEKMGSFVTFFPNWFLLNQVCYFLLWVIENKWSKWNSQLFNTLGFFSIKKKKKDLNLYSLQTSIEL